GNQLSDNIFANLCFSLAGCENLFTLKLKITESYMYADSLAVLSSTLKKFTQLKYLNINLSQNKMRTKDLQEAKFHIQILRLKRLVKKILLF
ncbi:hypothetical protein ABPG73_008272, partial [Tetrahymena malaccensis]